MRAKWLGPSLHQTYGSCAWDSFTLKKNDLRVFFKKADEKSAHIFLSDPRSMSVLEDCHPCVEAKTALGRGIETWPCKHAPKKGTLGLDLPLRTKVLILYHLYLFMTCNKNTTCGHLYRQRFCLCFVLSRGTYFGGTVRPQRQT